MTVLSTLRKNDDLAEVVIEGVKTGWFVKRNGVLYTTRNEIAALNLDRKGYVRNEIMRKHRHRHVLVSDHFVTNPRPDIFTFRDHIDGNRQNNHADNLRFVNNHLNCLNRRSCSRQQRLPRNKRKDNPQVHDAQVKFLYKQRYLGCYDTEEETIQVIDRTRQSLFEALYFYHTRPNTFWTPDKWIIRANRVRVRPRTDESLCAQLQELRITE